MIPLTPHSKRRSLQAPHPSLHTHRRKTVRTWCILYGFRLLRPCSYPYSLYNQPASSLPSPDLRPRHPSTRLPRTAHPISLHLLHPRKCRYNILPYGYVPLSHIRSDSHSMTRHGYALHSHQSHRQVTVTPHNRKLHGCALLFLPVRILAGFPSHSILPHGYALRSLPVRIRSFPHNRLLRAHVLLSGILPLRSWQLRTVSVCFPPYRLP